MRTVRSRLLWVSLIAIACTALTLRADLVINEILFNPPGSDAPNQYVELRGTPNLAIPSGYSSLGKQPIGTTQVGCH